MTQPHEVIVAQAEVERFLRLQEDLGTALALAAFLAPRVPDALEAPPHCMHYVSAFRAAVLRGPR